METYEAILQRMQEKFNELAGFQADSASDIGIRLKVLAGEIYSLQSGIEWLQGQAFPQTAQGDCLDLHAVQRGLGRKQAVPAAGELVFSRTTALAYDVQIPEGTICATVGMEGQRFFTTEAGVLKAGELSVTIPAQAQTGGRGGNVAAATIVLMMTPPSGIEAVSNSAEFFGGEDEETDEELRTRLLQSYAVVSNGTNGAFYREYALNCDGVYSAGVKARANGSGTVAVYIAGRGAAAPTALAAKIQQDLNKLREINVDVTVDPAVIKEYKVSLYIAPVKTASFEQAKQVVLEAVQAYFEKLSIGEPVVLAALGRDIMQTGLVGNYQFESNISTDKKMEYNELAVPSIVSIEEFEGAVV